MRASGDLARSRDEAQGEALRAHGYLRTGRGGKGYAVRGSGFPAGGVGLRHHHLPALQPDLDLQLGVTGDVVGNQALLDGPLEGDADRGVYRPPALRFDKR